MMKPGVRRFGCVVLAACLLLAPAGCRTGAQRAEDYRSRVEMGMSQGQVEERLGQPDGWQENVGGYEVWTYAYRPSLGHFVVWRTVDATVIVMEVAVVFGLVLGLAWLLQGNPPSYSDGRSGTDLSSEPSGRYQRFI